VPDAIIVVDEGEEREPRKENSTMLSMVWIVVFASVTYGCYRSLWEIGRLEGHVR